MYAAAQACQPGQARLCEDQMLGISPTWLSCILYVYEPSLVKLVKRLVRFDQSAFLEAPPVQLC